MSKPSGYKPFDRGLYDVHKGFETHVISILSTKLKEIGLGLSHNPDPYGIDILVSYGKKSIGGIEVEWHGKYWKDNVFPFSTVHFLGRKKKYVSHGAFYLMTNRTGSNALMIGFDELQHHGTKIMDNELCINEPIWDVPNDHCIWGWNSIIEALLKYYLMEMRIGESDSQ